MIELTKQYRLRGGRDFEILKTDAMGEFPVIILVKHTSGDALVRLTADGCAYPQGIENSNDLIEVKPERTGWVNIYSTYDPSFRQYSISETREAADLKADGTRKRIACVKITFREGDGL